MPKQKLPETWGDRDPLRGLRRPTAVDGQPAPAPSVLDTIAGPQEKPRGRGWEKRNRSYSYTIPAPLRETAIQVRNDILSIAQFDAEGNPRTDGTTTDDIARNLMSWALKEVQLNPGLLTPRPNARSRKGQMTVSWEAWESWDKTPVKLKSPVRRDKNKAEKKCVLTFRWGPEIDARVKVLAGVGTPGESLNNPFKFSVPVSDLVVRLLLLAIEGYKTRRYNFKIGVEVVSRVNDWEPM